MFQIAFCDDELATLNTLRVLLDQYRVERNQEIAYTAFQNPLELLAQIEKGTSYDILFLDILMPGQTGLQAAAEIRTQDTNVKIIFLTSSAEFCGAVLYGRCLFLSAQAHLEGKLLSTDGLCACGMRKGTGGGLILRCKSGITRIELRQMEYCEVIHRTIFFHLTNGTVLESTGSLDELSRQLQPYDCFLRVHRSYLINLDHVQSISYRSVTMKNEAEIPLPRGRYQETKEAYLGYAFQNRQVMV